ncbi:MAG: prolyl oligopeptidase family serine peptidase [Bacillota bacterium]
MTTRRRLTAEDLFQFRLPGDAQISPDGRRIAYVESFMRKESNDYGSRIMLLVDGAKPVPLTGGEKDSNPRWSPDGRYLSFSRGGQVWLLPTGGGEAWQLTRNKGCGGAAVWSPDSSKIALTALLGPNGLEPERNEGEQDYFKKFTAGVKVITDLHYKVDGMGFPGDKKPQIVIVDVESGEARQLTGGPFGHTSPAWSPCGKWISLAAVREEDAEDKRRHFIWVVPAEPSSLPVPDAEYRRLSPEGLVATGARWSPDGSQIAFVGRPNRRHAPPDMRLYVVPAEGGEVRCLTAAHDRPVGIAAAVDMAPPGGLDPTWAADGSAIYLPMSDHGAVYLARVDVASGEVAYLTEGDQVVFGGSVSADGARFALTVGRVDDPAQIYRLEKGGLRRLTDANHAFLAQVETAPVHRFRFRAGPDAPEVDGWLVEPAGREPGRKYPAVLEIHGGPAAMYPHSYFLEFQYLASLGFAVVYTNPRGGLGYGEAFSGALAEANWGTVDYQDLMAGVDAALAQYDWLDAERLGVAGGSYGGYMTNWIVGHTKRFQAAVTMRSISNWLTMWGTSDIAYDQIEEWGAPWEDETPWKRISPLTYVTEIQTPLLIEHQEEDHRCPVEQAEQLYVALRKLRRPVKFVRYPGESHGMSRGGRPWHRVHRLLTIGDWFQHYLQPQA